MCRYAQVNFNSLCTSQKNLIINFKYFMVLILVIYIYLSHKFKLHNNDQISHYNGFSGALIWSLHYFVTLLGESLIPWGSHYFLVNIDWGVALLWFIMTEGATIFKDSIFTVTTGL